MKRIFLTFLACLTIGVSLLAQTEGFTTHMVRWFERLEDISAQYGVPQDVIMAVNHLDSPKVTNRQKLLIPVSEKYWPSSQEIAKLNAPQSAEDENGEAASEATSDATAEERTEDFSVITPTDKISLGLVLPFGGSSRAQKNNALDFYSGVLMAVRELGGEGMDISLNVHDMAGIDVSAVKYEGNDIIIGPFRYADIEALLQDCGDNIIVSPLDQKTVALAENNANLVQAPPVSSQQYAASLEYEAGDNFIVITSEADQSALSEIETALKSRGIPYKTCLCSVQGEIEGWEKAYKEEVTNKVILAIASEAQLNNALRNMCIEESKGNVICYGNSKLLSYETIPVENIHRAHTRVLCSYYVDYKDSETLAFIHEYRALFHCEPNQFAFQGYDLAYFLCETFRKLGKGWRTHITEQPIMDLRQTSFKLKRLPDGGLVNTAGRKLEFMKDYNILMR